MKMDSFLQKLLNEVINAIATIGFDIMVSYVHGHSSIAKLYKKRLFKPLSRPASTFICNLCSM